MNFQCMPTYLGNTCFWIGLGIASLFWIVFNYIIILKLERTLKKKESRT
jgi:hypothetical protein